MIDDFNDYSIENNLNITIDHTFFSNLNSTNEYEFKSTIEAFVKGDKYDIYKYDNKNTPLYGKYLLDLNTVMDKNHINMYDSHIVSETSIYKNKLVGIVIIFFFFLNINVNIFNNSKIIFSFFLSLLFLLATYIRLYIILFKHGSS